MKDRDEGPVESFVSEDILDVAVANHMIRSAEFSYKTEMDRGNSIQTLASQMLTAVSVVSIALLTLLVPLLQFSRVSTGLIALLYTIIFIPLIGCLIFSLLSQYRYKHKTLTGPKSISQQIMTIQKSEDPFASRIQTAEHFCESIESSYASARKVHNLASTYLRVAVVLMIVSASFVFVSTIFVYLVYQFV